MDKQNMKELQLLYEAEMTDQSAFARGRRALFGDDYERARQCFQKAVSEGHTLSPGHQYWRRYPPYLSSLQ